MPRQVQEQIVNNFVRGLFTEATTLNFPEGAATETFDCIFDRTGLVTRRKGIDYEASYVQNTELRDDANIVGFRWENVGGAPGTIFFVYQIGRYLVFYDEDPDNALSNGIKSFEVDLNTYKVDTADPKSSRCQFASFDGVLFVANQSIDPIFIEYDSVGDSLTTTAITIQTRDLEGYGEAGVETDERPGTLTREHHYNLLNQGWYADAPAAFVEALLTWDNSFADFPSNADVWWLMLTSSGALDPTNLRNNDLPGNTPAPRGHYILNEFDKDRETPTAASSTSSTGTLADETTTSRPTAIASYAGRIWYAGVNDQKYITNLYYTQVIKSSSEYDKCYQINDPTSEHLSDTLATDGGVIKIPDMDKVVAMKQVGPALVIFASNGVWAVQGSEGLVFKSTDFGVTKISEVNTDSDSSFVNTERGLFWWATDGIYNASQNTQSSFANVAIENITEQTIQTFFDAIPIQSKELAQGAYNREEKVIQWVYRSTSDSDIDNRYNFDRVLNLNLITGAFYPWAIASVTTPPVYINSVMVSTVGDNDAFLYLSSEQDSGTSWDFTFADETDTTYTDWVSVDATGVDYTSYFVAGHTLIGAGTHFAQPNYIWFFMNNVTNSALQVRGYYDWSDSGDSGKWNNFQEAYLDRDNFSVCVSKLKFRGEGRSFQLYGESVTGMPFELQGWGMLVSVNQLP